MERFVQADKSLSEMDYVRARLDVLIAWSWVVHGYSDTMAVINDTLATNTIFFSIFLIFGIFFERLVFGAVGKKRFVTLFGTLIVLLFSYYLLHPAPKIATNFMMSPLSVTVEMLFIFVSLIFLNDTLGIVREVRRRVVGEHFSESTTVPITFIAFSYGVQNMRRRKTRTFLVMTSVLVVTFAMVALTSSYPAPTVSYAPVPNSRPVYVGMLIKQDFLRAPNNVLVDNFDDFIREQTDFAYPVSRRIWWYPQSNGGKEVYARIFNADNLTSTFTIKAILGLSPEEENITSYGSSTKGLWFLKGQYLACIIPEEAAQALNIGVGGQIVLGQRKLLVTGIYDSRIFSSYVDLDGYPITPVDPNNVIALKVGIVLTETRIPISWNEMIIVPDDLAIDLGGYVTSVAVGIGNNTDRSKLSYTLASTIQGSQIYSSDGETVVAPSPNLSYGLTGWTYMLMPLTIGAFTILNTILGNVKERIYEIGVYSAVGLSPRGIAFIFLTEAMIYGLTAGVLGYLLGMLANVFLMSRAMLPEGYMVNSSSMSTVLAIGVSMAFCLLAAAYPAAVASRLVTPSLERKWKMTTKPRGETWEIPLPFSMPEAQEALGVLEYINEYLVAHTVETPEPFIARESKIDRAQFKLFSTMILQPIEAEIIQELSIEVSQVKMAQRAQFTIVIKKLSGPRETWEAVNYKVIDVMRKQLLMWRSLSSEQRRKYMGVVKES
jgi:ABC-type antimicrobial peptide transport system permease subunit